MRDVCNAVTTFCGGGMSCDKRWPEMGNTTPYVLIEEEQELRR